MKKLVHEFVKFSLKSSRRLPLLWQIRNLVHWAPLSKPEDGYTIVIAAMHELWPVAAANLRLIAQCDKTDLREVLVVIDQTIDRISEAFSKVIREVESQGLKVRLLGYSPVQVRVARRIHWGWVYSWLSWCTGISEAKTRWVLLHDLDAMPIDPGVFHKQFRAAREAQCQFQGIRYYSGNGVFPEMRLATTFEMVLDAEWLRKEARPIECFNQIRLVGGRYVDFDTLLNVQQRAPLRSAEPIAESSLVHPTQLICQYTDLLAGRQQRIESANRLPVLYYFMHLGDPQFDLTDLGDQLADIHLANVNFFDCSVNMSRVEPSSWAWMEKQIRRLEQALYTSTRPHVQHFLRGMIARAGSRRTVGHEPIEAGGVAER